MSAANKVILADDDVMVRTVMKNVFKTIYPTVQVIEVSDGDAAIEALDEHVACVMMPERDGIDMCRVIRTSAVCAPYRDVPIVLVSALHAYDALAQRAWNAGTAFFMRKPFAVQDLIRTMTSATRLQPVAPPSVNQMKPAQPLQVSGTVGVNPVATAPVATSLIADASREAGTVGPNGQQIVPLRMRLAAKR